MIELEHLTVDGWLILSRNYYSNKLWQLTNIYEVIFRRENEYKKFAHKEVAYKTRLNAPEGYNHLAIEGTAFKS